MKSGFFGLWIAAGCALVLGSAGASQPGNDALSTPAVLTAKSDRAVLQAITRAGQRMVAVGERGLVLLSDDNGQSWRQASVPVGCTLTAVQFVDAANGWAVGHAGVILHSSDGGERWTVQLDGRQAAQLELTAASAEATDVAAQQRISAARRLVEDGADKPFLALAFADANHGTAVGAFGLAFHTDDGGATWASWMGRLPNPQGLHLYAVAQAGQQIYLVGEQGLVLRSGDGGERFDALASPYEGSYFSAALLPAGGLVIAGLRGKVFFSDDQGQSFRPVTGSAAVSVNAITMTGDRLMFVDQAGGVFQSDVTKLHLTPLQTPPGHPLTDVAQAPDGSLTGVGFTGVTRFSPAVAAAQSIAE
ncbi:YCF48-related protein [Pseudomonas sp. App30]|uniref:WD40/YVTN/BNR-like repeat-containing protein n=1 Tax=Pseudomonas sp. App30 TaxID=3068990 RepID=UPI003A7FCDA0